MSPNVLSSGYPRLCSTGNRCIDEGPFLEIDSIEDPIAAALLWVGPSFHTALTALGKKDSDVSVGGCNILHEWAPDDCSKSAGCCQPVRQTSSRCVNNVIALGNVTLHEISFPSR